MRYHHPLILCCRTTTFTLVSLSNSLFTYKASDVSFQRNKLHIHVIIGTYGIHDLVI